MPAGVEIGFEIMEVEHLAGDSLLLLVGIIAIPPLDY